MWFFWCFGAVHLHGAVAPLIGQQAVSLHSGIGGYAAAYFHMLPILKLYILFIDLYEAVLGIAEDTGRVGPVHTCSTLLAFINLAV